MIIDFGSSKELLISYRSKLSLDFELLRLFAGIVGHLCGVLLLGLAVGNPV